MAFNYYNVLNIVNLAAAGATIVLDVVALFFMFRMIPRMKFEKYVILSGMAECVLLIVFIATGRTHIIMLNVIKTLQLFILFYIFKRFLRFYFSIVKAQKIKRTRRLSQDQTEAAEKTIEQSEEKKSKKYSVIFWCGVTTAMAILIVSLVLDELFKANSLKTRVIFELMFAAFCLLLSVIVLIFAVFIRQAMLRQVRAELSELKLRRKITGVGDKSFELLRQQQTDALNEEESGNSVFLKTRLNQLAVVTISNVASDLLWVVVCVVIVLYLRAQNYARDALFEFFTKFQDSRLVAVAGMNYVGFFFCIRKSYTIDYDHADNLEGLDLKEEIKKLTENPDENLDIIQFIE